MTRLAPVTQAAIEVFRVFESIGARTCLIDGMAVLRWGQPRTTQDVDCTVLAPFGSEAPLIDRILEHLAPRSPGAREHAMAHRVLLLRASNGVGIDVSLAALPFEEEVIDRASRWKRVDSVWLDTCTAEDLVIYKLVAARPQDLIDVAGVIRRRFPRLDVDRIRRWGREFADLKEDPDLLRPFEEALRKAGN